MNPKLSHLVWLAALLIANTPLAAESTADGKRTALSAEVGTLGWGASGWYVFNDSLSANAGYNGFNYARDVTTDDVNYEGELKFKNFPVMFGWHPWKGAFRLVAGVVVADNKAELIGRPRGDASYEINGTTYTAAQVGTLNGTADLGNGVIPYAGLGWSKSPVKRGWGAFGDIGVMFSGSPSVSLSANGPVSTDSTFRANLAAEARKVNDELEVVKVFPVLRFGVMYRF